MIKIYNNKNNILINDNNQEEENVFNAMQKIVLENIDNQTIKLLFYSHNGIFFIKKILISDLDDGRSNLILKSEAFDYDGTPEENSNYIMVKDSAFMFFVENISSIFDASAALTIQMYKKNDLLIIRTNCPTYSNDYKQIESDKTFTEIIKENDPNYNDGCRSEKKKLRYLTDSRTSLAYIEVQLDLITQILFAILDSNDAINSQIHKKFDFVDVFKESIKDLYITKIKSIDSCMNEITENKAKMRQIQAEYYAIKNKK